MIGIDEDVITDFAYKISNSFEAINTRYIQLMGQHIKDIGSLTATDVHRTEQMIRVGTDCKKLKKQIAFEAGKSMQEIDELYDEILKASYNDSQYLYEFRFGDRPLDYEYNELLAYTQSMKDRTEDTFRNISRTTVIEQQYQDLVDKAVMSVTEGVTDYKSMMREELKKAAVGARVIYASGYTRRLDSAVRMNILDGARQLNLGLRDIEGRQFGADGIEVSAHALCAEDHLDIQGEQYSLREFERVNNALARQIGTMNCQHNYQPIILGISKPAYTKEELQELRNNSTQQITIDGRTKSRYQWSQECRRLETEMRYAKDKVIMGKAANDSTLVNQSQQHLFKLQSKYRDVCNNAGLTKHYDRAYVPGYSGKQVSPKKSTPITHKIPISKVSGIDKYKKLIPGKNDPEITDDIRDYFIPQGVRDRLSVIENMKTYSDFDKYFTARGIKLDVDIDRLKNELRNKEIESVYTLGQKLVVAIESYEEEFGKGALSSLTHIKWYDNDLDNTASYHFNLIGEHDPLAGTIRFRDWNVDGRTVFHELAHAFEDSQKLPKEDALLASNRLVELGQLDKTFKANTSWTDETEWAEKLADALGYGFSQGEKRGIEFIKNLANRL